MQAKDRPTYHMLLTGHDHGSTHPAIYLKVEWVRRIFQFFLSPQVGHQASITTATPPTPNPKKNNYHQK